MAYRGLKRAGYKTPRSWDDLRRLHFQVQSRFGPGMPRLPSTAGPSAGVASPGYLPPGYTASPMGEYARQMGVSDPGAAYQSLLGPAPGTPQFEEWRTSSGYSPSQAKSVYDAFQKGHAQLQPALMQAYWGPMGSFLQSHAFDPQRIGLAGRTARQKAGLALEQQQAQRRGSPQYPLAGLEAQLRLLEPEYGLSEKQRERETSREGLAYERKGQALEGVSASSGLITSAQGTARDQFLQEHNLNLDEISDTYQGRKLQLDRRKGAIQEAMLASDLDEKNIRQSLQQTLSALDIDSKEFAFLRDMAEFEGRLGMMGAWSTASQDIMNRVLQQAGDKAGKAGKPGAESIFGSQWFRLSGAKTPLSYINPFAYVGQVGYLAGGGQRAPEWKYETSRLRRQEYETARQLQSRGQALPPHLRAALQRGPTKVTKKRRGRRPASSFDRSVPI